MKVMIVRLDHLGDILLCTPMIRAIAKAGHRVEVVVPHAFLKVFENSPFVRHAHAIEDICPGFPRGWFTFSRWLRRQHVDTLLLPNARQRGLVMASACSGIRTRVAMWGGVTGRLTGHRCLRSGLPRRPRHFAEVMMDMARAVGVPGHDGITPDLFPSTASVESVGRHVSTRLQGLKLIGIHPGNGGNACNLNPDAYGLLAEQLLRREDVGLVITGTTSESKLVESWPSSVLMHRRTWNAMGALNLHELAALVKLMSVYVVPSTGPLHVASWARTPTVSPFCSSPGLTSDIWGNTSGTGVTLNPPESYCRDFRKDHAGHCQFGGYVTAERLADAVHARLAEERTSRVNASATESDVKAVRAE